MIIGALTSHFRKLWRVRELLDKKMQQADIGRELSINAFFLGDTVVQARNFSRRELKKIFEEFYRCDISSKTGGLPYTLMHGLTMGICTGSW
jgi:DNA polymerase-3 subunit delta